MQLPRSSGVLLHPTSLPGPYGIGGVGSQARRFVDFLAASGQRFWQILPLVPTGYGNSPYMSYSAFAGNMLLIDPELLVEEGLLKAADLEPHELTHTAGWGHPRVDFEEAKAYKTRLLLTACRAFEHHGTAGRADFSSFCEAEGWWLEDYALFMALKEVNDDLPWPEWDKGLALREPPALAKHYRELGDRIYFHRFTQYLFARQWSGLKRYANAAGVRILGDLPIYVAADSADVWANPDLFRLDDDGNPAFVSGVPPDYFSATGQLWGNPLYDWEAIARTGYDWWIRRLKRTLDTVDLVRIDHFRGFESFWEIQAGKTTAMDGRWVQGPGTELFDAIEKGLGGLPIVAEDLGVITPEVEQLRDHYGLYGMKVLQFGFDGDPNNPHLPHNYRQQLIAYTGTHDNDTTLGWYGDGDQIPWVRDLVRRYLSCGEEHEVHWAFIQSVLSSVSNIAILPVQDLLGLGSEARMNTPGTAKGNWQWRCADLDLLFQCKDRLATLSGMYGRWPS